MIFKNLSRPKKEFPRDEDTVAQKTTIGIQKIIIVISQVDISRIELSSVIISVLTAHFPRRCKNCFLR